MQTELLETDLMLKKWAAWNDWDQLNPGFASKTVLYHLIKEGAFYQAGNRLNNISRDTPTDVIRVDQAIRALKTKELIDVVKMKYMHLTINDEKRIAMLSESWGHLVSKPTFRRKVDYARWFIADFYPALTRRKIKMITWVDERLAEWGSWSRGACERLGYPKYTPIYQLITLGAIGAAVKSSKSNCIPMPINVEEVEAVIVRLPTHQQEILTTKYISCGTNDQKSKDLNMSRDCFLRELDWLHQVLSTQFHHH